MLQVHAKLEVLACEKTVEGAYMHRVFIDCIPEKSAHANSSLTTNLFASEY